VVLVLVLCIVSGTAAIQMTRLVPLKSWPVSDCRSVHTDRRDALDSSCFALGEQSGALSSEETKQAVELTQNNAEKRRRGKKGESPTITQMAAADVDGDEKEKDSQDSVPTAGTPTQGVFRILEEPMLLNCKKPWPFQLGETRRPFCVACKERPSLKAVFAVVAPQETGRTKVSGGTMLWLCDVEQALEQVAATPITVDNFREVCDGLLSFLGTEASMYAASRSDTCKSLKSAWLDKTRIQSIFDKLDHDSDPEPEATVIKLQKLGHAAGLAKPDKAGARTGLPGFWEFSISLTSKKTCSPQSLAMHVKQFAVFKEVELQVRSCGDADSKGNMSSVKCYNYVQSICGGYMVKNFDKLKLPNPHKGKHLGIGKCLQNKEHLTSKKLKMPNVESFSCEENQLSFAVSQ